LITAPHHNQQVFSDYYLDVLLPQRQDWQELLAEAESVRQELATIVARYRPGDKEAQAEHNFIRPVLKALGHTFEVQASLATPDGTKQPDYIFYRDAEALNANKGKRLTDTLLQSGAFAVGDAKYWDCPLDTALRNKGGDPFTNKNPSYQIAFYMQHSGLLWGILTNGRLWRLYHKSTAHKLDHFYEVDLPALLESAETQDFLYFYAFFRRAAFDAHPLGVAEILRESIEYAQGVSNSLKDQVYTALRHVAQGFLDFAPNQLSPDDPTTLKAIYDSSLIMLYRLLFILYAEARDLLPVQDSELYRENYSLRFISRYIAKNIDAGRIFLSDSTRIYFALKELFSYINAGSPPLKISTFNGGLFDPRRASNLFLETHHISDARLQQAIDMLTRISSNGSDERHFIDYRDLSVRNLGSIYEGLLEYHLETTLDQDGWSIDLLNDKGERKATGSYYTPDYIVKYLVDATVGPMLSKAVQGVESEKARIEVVLALKVLDPSMGSGHFLVEATEYIARFLVELNAHPETSTRDADLAYWKRRVAQSCIYGVDLNPLAVELAKLSLWLSTVARDRPLSFLDHHLRAGNALIGARLASLTYARNGNGKNGNGHEKNGNGHDEAKEQLSLFVDDAFRQSLTTAVDLMWLVEDSPAQTIEQVKEQEQLYDAFRKELIGKYGRLADLKMAAHYDIAIDSSLWKPLVDFATGRMLMIPTEFIDWLDIAAELKEQRQFFHWELEFPEIFFDRHGQAKKGQAGFDVVIGNPPWIRQEMFSEDKAALKRFYNVYHGMADLSTYFVELGNTFLKDEGRFGYIIPNKFVRANYGSALRQFLTTQVKLERIVDFGDLPIFAEAVTYPMIVLTSKQPIDETPVKYTRIRKLDSANLAASIEEGESSVPRAALTGEYWSLDGASTQSIIEQMKAVSVPLGEYVENKIFYGIKTGFNEAFVIDQRTRDRLIAEDEKSEEIIKPFVVGEDVKQYAIEYKKRYIILTKIGTPIERYPAIFAHLQRYQEQLEKRWDKGNHWWELRSCDYYAEFEKPKIMFPDIAKRCQFAYETDGYFSVNTTYIMPIDADQKYLLPLLNSSLIEFFFQTISAQIRGGYLRFIYQYVTQIPIRRIIFTTPGEERAALVTRGTTYYESGRREELLVMVEGCLANEPEQSDVVRDLLVYLAEQMIDLHRQRAQSLENFMLALESVLSDADLQRLGRLWTPPAAPRSTLFNENEPDPKALEAQEKLGMLASRQLDLRDDIGALNEEQWKWLVKRRLNKPDLVALTKIFRSRQPAIAALDKRIATTDRLIDQVVYRLYGLTDEEVVTVEARAR
jgi:TaqI-like C-terminal specificity domain/Eco57I restriction-modification methylase/N-6 DNA Methylase